MELVEVDAVGPERAQRGLARGAQVPGLAVDLPRAARAGMAALRGDDDVVAARPRERLGDQPLVVPDLLLAGAVGVGRVDERDPGVERGVDGADGGASSGRPGEDIGIPPRPIGKTSVPSRRRLFVE